jgi:hypothetical protein
MARLGAGSGKTHTVFGPPGIMAEAGAGSFGISICPAYGLCPRGLLDIVDRLQQLKTESSLKYELTVSAVELAVTEGNLDMFLKEKRGDLKFFSGAQGISLDKTTKPPQLYGMSEVSIDNSESLLVLFQAIASRNTKGTGMNDSSSRSHCFVFLSLYALDPATGLLRKSRFQFVDLAGSERLRDAHFGNIDLQNNLGQVEGVGTNFGCEFF